MITGPLVCRLCERDFVTEEDFARHKLQDHAGEAEYRKRVLFLMAEAGCRPIAAQEKRLMVQNFAHFQQFCHPGSRGNRFSGGQPVPRCEAACAVCAQKDYLEHRHKLSLFGAVPEGGACEPLEDLSSDQEDGPQGAANFRATQTIIKYRGVYYLQSPELVHQLLDVDRYRQRWPLIPHDQLHASSVQHPEHPEWRWLLHSRRVTVEACEEAAESNCAASRPADTRPCAAPQPADERPPSTGVGDADALMGACWRCLADLCAKKPKMPLNALVNDDWIGLDTVVQCFDLRLDAADGGNWTRTGDLMLEQRKDSLLHSALHSSVVGEGDEEWLISGSSTTEVRRKDGASSSPGPDLPDDFTVWCQVSLNGTHVFFVGLSHSVYILDYERGIFQKQAGGITHRHREGG